MPISRREFISAAAAGLAGGLVSENAAQAQMGPARAKLGIGRSSYGIRSRVERRKRRDLTDPLRFLEFCRSRGAGGVQTRFGIRDAAYAGQIREFTRRAAMFVEAAIRLPRNAGEVQRFDAEVRFAKSSGVGVFRTVMLTGRRYETFRSRAEFEQFRKSSLNRLRLAEPVAARHKVVLAVENHKDFRSEEFVELLKQIDSRHVGVCVDTGNNIALLEDVVETTKRLAPYAVSCHLKDMAVEENADGFLLSEVPLGQGQVDLKTVVGALRKARPEIHFCLEMITRDPLHIPCLQESYWRTFPELSGKRLARMLRWVRAHKADQPLPRISKLPEAQQLKIEEANVVASLKYAREHLRL